MEQRTQRHREIHTIFLKLGDFPVAIITIVHVCNPSQRRTVKSSSNKKEDSSDGRSAIKSSCKMSAKVCNQTEEDGSSDDGFADESFDVGPSQDPYASSNIFELLKKEE
eukprot:6898755-Ditylum_brightwellii.AAC.1